MQAAPAEPGEKSIAPPASAPATPPVGDAAASSPSGFRPELASEQALKEQLSELVGMRSKLKGGGLPELTMQLGPEILAVADALLVRFPDTTDRENALLQKLDVLADLARLHPQYLDLLRITTDQIAASQPSGNLASENAFYSIQAFVLGSRAEAMPSEKQLLGALERYKAFVEEHRESPRRPVIWASLIRNAIALRRIDEAVAEHLRMEKAYPGHTATVRAKGEVFRAIAIGKPFRFEFITSDGQTVRSADYAGKVIVLHFWANWSEESVAALSLLKKLHDQYQPAGLQFVGVNVDSGTNRTDAALASQNLPWPQYHDAKGLKNDLLVNLGVTRIPAYFLADRAGVLRAIDPGDLEAAVKLLMDALGAP